MSIQENVPLSSLTTLRVGGRARFVAECRTKEDVQEALLYAREHSLPWSVLGEGSNVLAGDNGYQGIILLVRIPGITETAHNGAVLLSVGAGVNWDTLVRDAAARTLWGLENLAGIPGTVGAAPVQNIGAYGAEVKDTLHEVHAIDASTGKERIFTNTECAFGYRESRFKKEPNLIITSVSFLLSKDGTPQVGYKDLANALAEGVDLSSPESIGDAVRAIRTRKFPDLTQVGTAGSFFKNPTISEEAYTSLKKRYPDLPGFPNEHGVKVPLAFILDHVLNLRGYTEGNVSLFERQPLVLVTQDGATADEVDAFAHSVAERVMRATGIKIEREVRNFPS